MVATDYPSVLVVRTDEISLATKSRGSEDKHVVLLAASIPIAISIVAGLLGWLIVGPGRSLLVPTIRGKELRDRGGRELLERRTKDWP